MVSSSIGAEKYKINMNLEHLGVPDSKKILKKDQGMSKRQKSKAKGAPNGQSQGNLSSKINNDMIKYPRV